MENQVIFYTTHCPKCKALLTLMTVKKIEHTIVDDRDTVMKVAEEHGILSAPFASINGEIYDVKKLQQWIKEH